jgi:16S rRNA (guanine527-N7)-methyltransferase
MFHVKHEAWARDALSVGVDLRDEQVAALARYESQLASIAVPRGFVARSDADRLWHRHILDALRAAPEIPPGASVLDLGSGAGIPGIPLAISTDAAMTLVDVRRSRVAFLEAVRDELRLGNVQVRLGRAEQLDERFDVCVARAFASAERTWEVAEPLLRPGGSLIYWAGSSFRGAELEGIGARWRLSEHPDLADSGALVIMGRQ